MDCDGLKKNIVVDLDGTFLTPGTPSVAFSESEFEWDVNPVRGLGDYRIPKTMLTAVNGSRIDPPPKKGTLCSMLLHTKSTGQCCKIIFGLLDIY